MEENAWLEYALRKGKELSKAPNPIRRHQPRIQRNQSSRMRTVGTQSAKFVPSVYKDDARATPLAPPGFEGTRNLGGNAEEKNGSPTGQNTAYRKAGMNKK